MIPSRRYLLPPVLLAQLAFLLVIAAANYATSTYGLVPVGLGLVATAGTWLAGLTFVLRDLVDDLGGRVAVMVAVAAGCALSLALSNPAIAVASVAAFAVSELVDFGIYRPLRRHGYVRAAVASNVAGSLVDTIVFLAIAGFPILPAIPGQMLAKLTVTALVVLIVLGVRCSTWRTRAVTA